MHVSDPQRMNFAPTVSCNMQVCKAPFEHTSRLKHDSMRLYLRQKPSPRSHEIETTEFDESLEQPGAHSGCS